MTGSNKDQTSLKDGLINYFKGVRLEWGKITWPEKQQVVVETIYVIVIVFVFTILVLLLDLLFKGFFDMIKGIAGN
ncbi:MAG: preprotein translocase subunit SecE [Candidatus Gastranaerophilales bacterium]|nr:preprotein translocase subunit SecE [Candidatus Gastranaerophilales bacterium]